MIFNSSLIAILLLVSMARVVEVMLGELNARKMLDEGGREFAPRQRLPIFAVYALWLGALAFLTPAHAEPNAPMLAGFALLQGLRWWAIYHLGRHWTARVIAVPLAFKVTTGPYRFLRHPIYLVLMLEIMVLSLAFQQWGAGCFFTGLAALWVRFRMKAESRALQMML